MPMHSASALYTHTLSLGATHTRAYPVFLSLTSMINRPTPQLSAPVIISRGKFGGVCRREHVRKNGVDIQGESGTLMIHNNSAPRRTEHSLSAAAECWGHSCRYDALPMVAARALGSSGVATCVTCKHEASPPAFQKILEPVLFK